MSFNIVLYQPEIPANTGNIGRLCVGTNSVLHIIKPMKFLITDKYLKRAGLDYWKDLKVKYYQNWEEFISENYEKRKFYFTTKSNKIYSNISFKKSDFLIFGPETRGLPESILKANWKNAFTIPMSEKIRSINLSNSVAIVLYEAVRKTRFF
ncbi:MAG: tRNA (cytidine(34)-2'-O)-methyltransferase [Candidatus Cloacimonetes bacterium]|nr:tRNA (cytidine(34)-2'-O)-methyltransferase [Candidatus Cloacimonadota bacterium]MBL7107810.1 tRNA (cytidine(34)-2'-O)-methyltransferase [Candidatus Cloacimonadota bacterium]